MDERLLARLRLDGVPVADYVDGGELDPVLSPRPYLHPVRTLRGVVVTDARPADHRWHLGSASRFRTSTGGTSGAAERMYVARATRGAMTTAGSSTPASGSS